MTTIHDNYININILIRGTTDSTTKVIQLQSLVYSSTLHHQPYNYYYHIIHRNDVTVAWRS